MLEGKAKTSVRVSKHGGKAHEKPGFIFSSVQKDKLLCFQDSRNICPEMCRLLFWSSQLPSPPGDPLVFLLSFHQGDGGHPRKNKIKFCRSSQDEGGQRDMQANFPRKLGGEAGYKRVNFFANARRQFCFAELALVEMLLKGIQNPLCLWTSKLLPKYHSNTCRHLN